MTGFVAKSETLENNKIFENTKQFTNIDISELRKLIKSDQIVNDTILLHNEETAAYVVNKEIKVHPNFKDENDLNKEKQGYYKSAILCRVNFSIQSDFIDFDTTGYGNGKADIYEKKSDQNLAQTNFFIRKFLGINNNIVGLI